MPPQQPNLTSGDRARCRRARPRPLHRVDKGRDGRSFGRGAARWLRRSAERRLVGKGCCWTAGRIDTSVLSLLKGYWSAFQKRRHRRRVASRFARPERQGADGHRPDACRDRPHRRSPGYRQTQRWHGASVDPVPWCDVADGKYRALRGLLPTIASRVSVCEARGGPRKRHLLVLRRTGRRLRCRRRLIRLAGAALDLSRLLHGDRWDQGTKRRGDGVDDRLGRTLVGELLAGENPALAVIVCCGLVRKSRCGSMNSLEV